MELTTAAVADHIEETMFSYAAAMGSAGVTRERACAAVVAAREAGMAGTGGGVGGSSLRWFERR